MHTASEADVHHNDSFKEVLNSNSAKHSYRRPVKPYDRLCTGLALQGDAENILKAIGTECLNLKFVTQQKK
jgi:hypothetical protein